MMTLKDIRGWLTITENLLFCGESVPRVQGSHNLQSSFALWFFCPGGLAGVGFAVLKRTQWLLPLPGSGSCCRWAKRGWWDSRSFPSAVLTHSLWHWGFPWPAAPCVAFLLSQGTGCWGCRAALQLQQAGAWWSESAPPSQLGSGSLGEQPAFSLGCRHLHAGSLPSCTAFQLLMLTPAFHGPSLGPPVSRRAQLHLFYGLSSAGQSNALLILAHLCSWHWSAWVMRQVSRCIRVSSIWTVAVQVWPINAGKPVLTTWSSSQHCGFQFAMGSLV